MKMVRFQVRSFGQDCLGNVTGYRVIDTTEHRVCGQFVGDIYETGSHMRAYTHACTMARSLEESTAAE
jgi:hypothetical protein